MSLGIVEREWKTCNTVEREGFTPPPETNLLPHIDLVTCNRTARFFWTNEPSFDDINLRRLFRITAGLESMAIGETQILGQVRDAYHAAKTASTTCNELDDIFEATITTAKRIHREIDFSSTPQSVCEMGITLAERRLGGLNGKRVMIIGAGKTATLAAHLVHQRGAAEIIVSNRSIERTEKLAQALPIRAVSYISRYAESAKSDLVICATSSPHLIIEAAPLPPDTKAVFLDLAYPPDVENSVNNRIGLDDLALQDEPTSPAKEAIFAAERIIECGIADLMKSLRPAASTTYRIGTRGSCLAMIQAEFVRDRLIKAYPQDSFEIKVISTAGDRITDRSIAEIGGNAVFSHDLERAILDGTIDLAVHSMKDLAATTPAGLVLAKSWTREDPRDVLVSRDGRRLMELPAGAKIGTGSVRRTALLKNFRPDLEARPLRGNVDTRLRKLFNHKANEEQLDAIILAAAGLKRLGRTDVITEYLDPTVWISAANQGQLAIELRAGDHSLKAKLDALGDDEAEMIATAERNFLAELNADCHQPIGAYAELANGKLKLHCVYGRDNSPLMFVNGANAVRRRIAGKVVLVGAGIGDADLITVKALKLIREADCIVYDRLISNELLKYAPANCELIYVGKSSHSHTMPQSRINAILADSVLKHRLVIRLKGGDPFVFGRGGEEVTYLRERDISVEVVSGVSSAIAAPSAAGIPLTQRGIVGAFRVISAHGGGDKPSEINFTSMSDERETLVFLMGLSALPRIVEGLVKIAKRDPSTPIAILSSVKMKDQKFVFGTLADIVEKSLSANLEPPATIAVGPTVKLRPPLIGMRILLPTIGEPKSEYLALLKSTGAIVDTLKVGEIHETAEEKISDADWVIITSSNAVSALKKCLCRPLNCKIAAVGSKTAAALAEAGIMANLVGDGNAAQLETKLKSIIRPDERAIHFKPYKNISIPLGTIDLSIYDAVLFTATSARERVLAASTGNTNCFSLGPSTNTYTFEDLVDFTVKTLTHNH